MNVLAIPSNNHIDYLNSISQCLVGVFLSTFSLLVAVCPSEVHKELLSRIPPGAAVGVSTTSLYKHVGHDRDTETITGSLLCLLLLYLLPCPWFCSISLLSRRVKNQYFPLFWLRWLQGHTVRATGKGMVFPSYILANQRFAFSSLWKSLRTQKRERKGNISTSLLLHSLLVNTVKQDCRPDPLLYV